MTHEIKETAEEKRNRRNVRAIGIGLAALVMAAALWWSATTLADPSAPTRPVAHVARLGVVLVLIGVYPATYIAYLEFRAKNQRERLKEDFQLLGLVSKADLDRTVETLYQTVYHPVQFLVFILLIIVFVLLVVAGYLSIGRMAFLAADEPRLVFFAFLGAYFFSVQELIRRYNTFDLLPQVYSSIFVRMTAAVLLAFVAAQVLSTTQESEVWVPMAAFLLGAFPQSGLQWITDSAGKVLAGYRTNALNRRPLANIIGISPWHEARLLEMGMDDAQNLATADLGKMLLTTQFDTQAIINWIDQAILYVKVGDKIDRFRAAQIITFSDLRTVVSNQMLQTGGAEISEEAERRRELWRPLLTLLGFTDESELRRLLDYGNYPNYAHIAQYYANRESVVRQRAMQGRDLLIGDGAFSLAGVIMLDGGRTPSEAEQKDLDAAVEAARLLVAQHSSDCDRHLELAIAYHRAGKHKEARASYEQALKLKAGTPGAHYGLSALCLDEGNGLPEGSPQASAAYREAIKHCTAAIDIDPTFASAYNNRGLAYTRLNYLDQALKDLDRAIELDRTLEVCYLNRSLVHLAQTNFARADRDLEIAYLLGHRSPTLWVSWGAALIGLERFGDAIQPLSQAVLYEKELALAYNRRGFAYMELGPDYFNQAKSDFEAAIDKDPKMTHAHGNLGLLAVHQGNDATAVTHYQKALELDDKLYLIRYNLAEALYRLKEYDRAENEFKQVVTAAPVGSPDWQQAMEALRQLWRTRPPDATGGASANGATTGVMAVAPTTGAADPAAQAAPANGAVIAEVLASGSDEDKERDGRKDGGDA